MGLYKFVICVDAPEAAAGAFLAERDSDDFVANINQRFNMSEIYHSSFMICCCPSNTTLEPICWRNFICVADHVALPYPYTMQGTSNTLTRWVVALQSFDILQKLKPGKVVCGTGRVVMALHA